MEYYELSNTNSNIFITSFNIILKIVLFKHKSYSLRRIPDNVYTALRNFYDVEIGLDSRWDQISDNIYLLSGIEFNKDKKFCFDLINNLKGERILIVYYDLITEAAKDISQYLYQLRKLFSAVISCLDRESIIEDKYAVFLDSPSTFEYSIGPTVLSIKLIYEIMDGLINKEELQKASGLKMENLDIILTYDIEALFLSHYICKIR